MVASRNVGNAGLHGAEVVAAVNHWPADVVWLDDLDVPAPKGKARWFQWSGVAALGFAATLDVERIVVVGADMGGNFGGLTAGDNVDRSAKRWALERVLWDWNSRVAATRGIEVVRMLQAESVAGGV